MANINVQRKHQLSLDEMKTKIDAIMTDIKDKVEFQSEWESAQEFVFYRKGAKGSIEIGEENFELNLNLGIMFRAMKSVIEAKIIEVVDKRISQY